MDTPATPAEGSSPATSAPTAPAAAPVAATPPPNPVKTTPSVAETVRNLTPQQRRDIISRRTPPVPVPVAPPKTPPTAGTPATEPASAASPAATTPAAPPGTTGVDATAAPPAASTPEGSSPGEPAREGPDRFRFKDPEDQAIALIAKSRGVGLAEAARLYKGEPTPAAPAAPSPAAPATPVAPTPPVPPAVDPGTADYDQQLAATRKRVEELTAQRTKLREDAEFDKVDELNDQLADLRADVKLLENERQGYVRAQQAEREQAEWQSAQRAYAAYPAFASNDSMERMALDAYVHRQSRDPQRQAIFARPTWPEVMAAEFAAIKGINGGAAQPAGLPPAAAPAPALLKSQPRQMSAANGKLLTSADGTPPSQPGGLTPEQIRERIRTDPEFRRGLVRNLQTAERK